MNRNNLSRILTNRFATEIKMVINKIPFLSFSVHSFFMCLKKDESLVKQLKFCFELNEKISFIELGLIHKEISETILFELQILNRDLMEFLRENCTVSKYQIEFFSPGQGPFLH